MLNLAPEAQVITHLIAWGGSLDAVRAMILTSTRAVPSSVLGANLDLLSDYDVILVLTDIHPFAADRAWLEAFGRVLVMYSDPVLVEDGFERSGVVVQFEGGLKIDFTLLSVEQLRFIAAQPMLPAEFEAGYRVLLDKDRLTVNLRLPTYKAYIPTPPTEAEYLFHVEDFFLVAIYVAKYLWRDDLIAAKHLMDLMMLHEHLLPLLQWSVEIAYQWQVKMLPYGRGLKRWLRADLWEELEQTYVGADPAANWAALEKLIVLFQHVAVEVGEAFGYTYPDDVQRRVEAHLNQVKTLPRAGS